MGVKLGELSFGFLNMYASIPFMAWVGRIGACSEGLGSDDSLIHLTGCDMPADFTVRF